MKSVLAIGAAALVAAALAWTFFPTTLGAAHYVYEPMSAEEFSLVRSSAIDFHASLARSGVELQAGGAASQSFGFRCRGVPVLLVINDPMGLSVLSFSGSERRSPAVTRFAGILKSELVPLSAKNTVDAPNVPGALEAFVLKHRDGVDISTRCR